MGQTLSCTSCKFRSTKIAPLGTLPSVMKRSNPSIVGQKTFSFHRPSHSSPEWLSVELSNCSSLATISLGSVKTLSSKLKGEITNNEITAEENKESSPSSKKHPGRFKHKEEKNFHSFKFKFKFIYSHLFSYNTTTIGKKKK